MSSSEVSILKLVTIPLLHFNPASLASFVSGLTPIERITKSASIYFPLYNLIFKVLSVYSSNSVTPSDKKTSTPYNFKC